MNVRPSHLCDPGIFDFAGLMRAMPQDETDLNQNIPNLRDPN
jgi:tRNA 2-thiocytidine biosynthesis protein TtcA